MKRREPPDKQVRRVYAAEEALKLLSTRYETVAECQAFVDKVIKSKFWRKRTRKLHPNAREDYSVVMVRDGRGRKTAYAGGVFVLDNPKALEFHNERCGPNHPWVIPDIRLPTWFRTDWIMLHELAHHLTTAQYGCYEVMGHGPEFCRQFLDLVKEFMGEPAHTILMESFWNLSVVFDGDKGRIKERSKRFVWQPEDLIVVTTMRWEVIPESPDLDLRTYDFEGSTEGDT